MWPLRSLCVQTDLFVASFDAVIADHGDFLVVSTPQNPDGGGRWPDAPGLLEPAIAQGYTMDETVVLTTRASAH